MKLLTFLIFNTLVQALLVRLDVISKEIAVGAIYFGNLSVITYEYVYILQCLLRFWVWFGKFCEKYLNANKEFQ